MEVGIIRDLTRLFPGCVQTKVPLHEVSRWRIGGLADVVVSPRNSDELSRLRYWLHLRGLPSIAIGASSNLLFSDDGLHAIAIHIGEKFSQTTFRGSEVVAGAGVLAPLLARASMHNGLQGLEHICGIPGTIGGLVTMNGGSLRRYISDSICKITSIDPLGNAINRAPCDCMFGYRTSIYRFKEEVISEVHLRLTPGNPTSIRKDMLQILKNRRNKFPRKIPNCGSVFASNPMMYASIGTPGAAIERQNLKGFRIGGAQISTQHANFIINTGGATSSEVIRLIMHCSDSVLKGTGFRMNAEVIYVTPNGDMIPADQVFNTP